MDTNWKVVVDVALFSAVVAFYALSRVTVRTEERIQQRRRKKQSAVNIGAIFGMDIGGTLTKVIYFETKLEKVNGASPLDPLVANTAPSSAPRPVKRASTESLAQLDQPDHQAALEQLYTYMDNNQVMKNSDIVIRDDVLSIYSKVLGGRLHFLHFETRNMVQTIKFLSSNALAENITSIGCTGGGSHKYADEFQQELEITFNKFDELGCLVRGMHFALTNFKDECYTFRNAVVAPVEVSPGGTSQPADPVPISVKRWQKDLKEYTQRVDLPYEALSSFPYLVVNIGSGVSILKVSAPGVFERVSGSSLGGGTYWGLCRLLTKCATYDEVLDVAETGDAGQVDMLVKDIYGGDYGGILSGSMVASSFGKLVMKENPREGVKEEDLALALLMMITNNIGQVAHLNAQLHHCSKIFFVGSFLRHNPISARRLAFAIDFWSSGSMEALFLVHEGYFGALGTFLQSAFGEDVDGILSSKDYCGEQVGPSKQPSTQQSPTKPNPRAGSSSSLSNLEEAKGGDETDTPDSNRSPLGKYITTQFAKWRNKSFSNSTSNGAESVLSVDSADQGDDSTANMTYPRKNRSSSDDYAVRSPRISTSSVGGSGKNHGRSNKL